MTSNHISMDQQHSIKTSSNMDDKGNTVLLRVLSVGPAEVYEWGVNSKKQPYEKYKWCEDDFYEDSRYIKIISTEELLDSLKIQPVGNGLADMICSPANVETFIDYCNAVEITIKGFTWWCHVTEEHKPCGMGGPSSKYYEGWFSEIPMDNLIRFSDNESYREFFKNRWLSDREYKDCYWPGFWLEE